MRTTDFHPRDRVKSTGKDGAVTAGTLGTVRRVTPFGVHVVWDNACPAHLAGHVYRDGEWCDVCGASELEAPAPDASGEVTYAESGGYYYLNADTLTAETAHRTPMIVPEGWSIDDEGIARRPFAAPLTRDDARYAITAAGLRALGA